MKKMRKISVLGIKISYVRGRWGARRVRPPPLVPGSASYIPCYNHLNSTTRTVIVQVSGAHYKIHDFHERSGQPGKSMKRFMSNLPV